MPIAAKRKIEVARDQLAGKEMDTARYYQKRRDYIAAINRFKVVVTQYQTTRHVEEALMRLTETYMSLGIVNEAQTAAAVLGHNFPDSPWYKDAYALVKSGGLEPAEDQRLLDQQGVQDGVGLAAELPTGPRLRDRHELRGKCVIHSIRSTRRLFQSSRFRVYGFCKARVAGARNGCRAPE